MAAYKEEAEESNKVAEAAPLTESQFIWGTLADSQVAKDLQMQIWQEEEKKAHKGKKGKKGKK